MRVDLRDSDERLGYFAWAVEQLISMRSIALYMASSDSNVEAAVEWLKNAITGDLYGEQPRSYPAPSEQGARSLPVQYAEAIGGFPGSLGGPSPSPLDKQLAQFGADVESISSYAEDVAYRLMLTCFLGTLDGNIDALRWLTTLMVRGGANRQLTISRFLALATFGRIGDLTVVPPDYDSVLRWAGAASTDLPLEGALPYMVAEYISRAHGTGVQTVSSN
jgi:hypothetical protein